MSDPTVKVVNEEVSPLGVILETRGLPAPAKGKVRNHPLFIVLVGALATSLLALACVTVALVITFFQKDDLQTQLTCRSEPAVVVDEKIQEELAAIGEGLAANGSSQSSTLQALAAIQVGDQAKVEEVLKNVPALAAELDRTADELILKAGALADAVEERRKALDTC